MGNSTFGGDEYGTLKLDTADNGSSTRTLDSGGTWDLTDGDSTATGTTIADWAYSGNGTSIDPTHTYDTNGDGDNRTENTYTLFSDWAGNAWSVNDGSQNTTVTNSGDWDTTTSQAYSPTFADIAMSGTQTLSHGSSWDVTGTQAQSLSSGTQNQPSLSTSKPATLSEGLFGVR